MEILHGFMAAQQGILRARQWQDRAGRIRQNRATEVCVMTELTKVTPAVDGFEGFEDRREGDARPQGRVIDGTIVRFTNEATWLTREEDDKLQGAVEARREGGCGRSPTCASAIAIALGLSNTMVPVSRKYARQPRP